MNNRVKIIISILSAIIILAIAGISVFLVLTAVSTTITSNNVVVSYYGGDLAVDVKITAEYYDATFSIDGSSVHKVVETKAEFSISPYATGDNLTKSIDIGNIDFEKYGVSSEYYTLIFVFTVDPYITKSSYSVTFAYQDTGDLDSNVYLSNSAKFTGYSGSILNAGSFSGYIKSGATAWSGSKTTTTSSFNSGASNYRQLTYTLNIRPHSDTANSSMSGNFLISFSKKA